MSVSVTCPACKGHVNLRTNECACDRGEYIDGRLVHHGDLTTTCDGQRLASLHITGRLLVKHRDVVVTDCHFAGGEA